MHCEVVARSTTLPKGIRVAMFFLRLQADGSVTIEGVPWGGCKDRVYFRNELPKTSVGKILRRALRDELLKKHPLN